MIHHTSQHYSEAVLLTRHHNLTGTLEKVILAIFTPRIVTTIILLFLLAHQNVRFVQATPKSASYDYVFGHSDRKHITLCGHRRAHILSGCDQKVWAHSMTSSKSVWSGVLILATWSLGQYLDLSIL